MLRESGSQRTSKPRSQRPPPLTPPWLWYFPDRRLTRICDTSLSTGGFLRPHGIAAPPAGCYPRCSGQPPDRRTIGPSECHSQCFRRRSASHQVPSSMALRAIGHGTSAIHNAFSVFPPAECHFQCFPRLIELPAAPLSRPGARFTDLMLHPVHFRPPSVPLWNTCPQASIEDGTRAF